MLLISIMRKIPEISWNGFMEWSVAVSSNRNIRDHFWRWSTYVGPNIILTEIQLSICFFLLQTGSINALFLFTYMYVGNLERNKKFGLIGKCCPTFLGCNPTYLHVKSLPGGFSKMSTQYFKISEEQDSVQ